MLINDRTLALCFLLLALSIVYFSIQIKSLADAWFMIKKDDCSIIEDIRQRDYVICYIHEGKND